MIECPPQGRQCFDTRCGPDYCYLQHLTADEYNFRRAYEPCIGKRLAAIAWRPFGFDTANVVAALANPVLKFSGSASLFFEDDCEITLACIQGRDNDYYLQSVSGAGGWRPYSLDLIHVNYEGSWNDLGKARLRTVSLFEYESEINPYEIAAAMHEFATETATIELWIAVDWDSHDEVLVCLGARPPNVKKLKLATRFTE